MSESHAPEQDLIQAALTQAFSIPNDELVTVVEAESLGQAADLAVGHVGAAYHGSSADASAVEISTGSSSNDSWKTEYETQVQSWRAQSAEAREKAEKERERWEAVRAAEKEEAARIKLIGESQHTESEWEGVASSSTTTPVIIGSPSPIDVRDLVTGEHEKENPLAPGHNDPPIGISRALSQQDTNDGSQKWEEVHSSMTSSFPSVTFPESSSSAPPNATLTIFDPSLSTRTRVTAFFSSLAINMLLPFVNGVMLGFGEIFAKNFIMQWLGWQPSGPGYVARTTGIGFLLGGKVDRKFTYHNAGSELLSDRLFAGIYP
ncbi:hypothetical protein BDQ17DRAFT_1548432 [Cyathus striatus]|nr:hypothetical protein BDQ17DRAFT_1548432 [Cyathus striatus]